MKKRLTILAFVALINFSFLLSLTAKTITGTVFHDLNDNQKLDKDEVGVPGVLVSNQRDVVRTDDKGQYKLEGNDESIIFITKPSQWKTPLDKNNLPQFYYIHQPKGSPKFKYKGIPPTGKLPERLNFPLYKSDDSDEFEVIVFGDPQSRDEAEIGYLRDDVISEMIGTTAQFVIELGDILFDDLSHYDLQNQVLAQIGIPVYNVPGNHDENYDAPDDHYATETYKSVYGPNYYSFDYGQVHFVILDDVEYLGKDEKGRSRYQGNIGKKQLTWLKNDLALVPDNKLIVLNMHIPLYYGDGSNRAINVLDRFQLFDILKERKSLLALAGHMHTIDHYFLSADAGWNGADPLHQIVCTAACGAWWSGQKDYRGIPMAMEEDGVPNGYHIFKFSGIKYSERFKAAGMPENVQMRISYPQGKINKDSALIDQIVVNVFNGSEKSVVQFLLDNGEWETMKLESIEDPIFELSYSFSDEGTPSWIKPRPASHIWTAPLPADLNSGVHKIVVNTVDQYGQKFSAFRLFEVE